MDQQCLWKHKSCSQAETATEATHAARLSWEPALSDSQSVHRGRPHHLEISFYIPVIRSTAPPSLTGRRCQSRSGSMSGTLSSRCQAKALLARSNQHLLMATWPSCTVQMLERNWVVIVVDQGPTAWWRKTRREKFEYVPAYDIALTMKKINRKKQNNWKNILPKLWWRQLVFPF